MTPNSFTFGPEPGIPGMSMPPDWWKKWFPQQPSAPAPGTNAPSADDPGWMFGASENDRDWMGKIQTNLGPLLRGQIKSLYEMEPWRMAAIRRAVMLNQPGNRFARNELYRRQATAAAAERAKQAAIQARAAGIDQAGIGSIGIDLGNDANEQANDHLAKLNSPEGDLQSLQSILGVTDINQILTALDPILKAWGATTQLEQINAAKKAAEGDGFLGDLLGMAGQVAGMGSGISAWKGLL